MFELAALWVVYHRVDGPSSATVPLALEGNAPIVELQIQTATGGWRPTRFVVDSGGGAFIVGSGVLADIAEKPAEPAVAQEGDRFVTLPGLTVRMGDLPLDLSGVRTLGLPDHRWMMMRNRAEGLIPAALLRHYSAIFDYPKHQFTLAKPGTTKPRGHRFRTPIGERSGFVRLEIQVGGKPFGFLLDTGASFTMVSRAQIEEWKKQFNGGDESIGAVGFANMFGGPVEATAMMRRLPTLTFGDWTLENVAAVGRPPGTFETYMSSMTTAPIVGAIGGNVLRDYRVEIDYSREETYFEKSGHSSDFDLTTVGLVLTEDFKGNLIVSGVASKAAPDVKEGVRAGDQLVAVDDVPLADHFLSEAAQVLSGAQGSKKKLTLLRDGKSIEVTVTVKRIL